MNESKVAKKNSSDPGKNYSAKQYVFLLSFRFDMLHFLTVIHVYFIMKRYEPRFGGCLKMYEQVIEEESSRMNFTRSSCVHFTI